MACVCQTNTAPRFRRAQDDQQDGLAAQRSLLAVDARLDNRGELIAKLDLPDRAVDDPSLVLLGYRRWGEQIVDHILGDFAIAAWDPIAGVLTLIRDPTGQRPLHYRRTGELVAFASMPQGLFGLGPCRPDTARLGRFVADVHQAGPETFYEGILRVEPAQIVRITRDEVRARTYWSMPTHELRYRDERDYVEAYREQLDRATRARLRGHDGLVAAHLSAGLDSGAVATTAARLLAGEGRVLAVTSAPRLGFAGPVPSGRIADESEIAATVVARYPNLEHLILRSGGASPLASLESDSRLFAQPVGFPCNNVWWRAANAAAQARGAGIMLTGEMGNLTISAGGLGVLADFIRGGDVLRWAREMIALRRNGPRWRGLMAASFAPWMSDKLWNALTRLSAGGRGDASGQLSPVTSVQTTTSPTYRSERDRRWALLKQVDPGTFRKGAWLNWGVEERDPTSDRRLIEFCFSLPPSQLLGAGKTRRLARSALSDRLPATILDGVRGYQFADWFEELDRDALARFADKVAASPAAAAAVDFDAVHRLIAEWPVGGWASARTIGTYRIGLLRALSAGAFALNACD
ncbi:asparagine synthase-related protein [Sphingomonas sp.]|uniref:asparagine synthase-related protein n=1 Tax=Sphingomonas sp. TaxID=28214 RepID=UPI002D7FB489|nr:asparagine synthase-related protein [Sphingomonas sp.]HEU0044535.1 asparagine synthase-related protein [Sphingomonas sp.]